MRGKPTPSLSQRSSIAPQSRERHGHMYLRTAVSAFCRRVPVSDPCSVKECDAPTIEDEQDVSCLNVMALQLTVILKMSAPVSTRPPQLVRGAA